jgi:DNA oxidative demethylase
MTSRKKIIYRTEPPEGLFYIPHFLTREQEQELLIQVSTQPFEPYDHHGYKANREVVYFGTEGGYGGIGAGLPTEPMPCWLIPLRDHFGSLIGLSQNELAMALVARYSVGAGIGWHRDRPQFGPTVVGISLASEAEMRFRRFVDENEEMFKINLDRGSAYIISGPARSVWQHGMTPVKQLRYSITFRTIRDKQNGAIDVRHSPELIATRLATLQLDAQASNTHKVPQSKQLKLSL